MLIDKKKITEAAFFSPLSFFHKNHAGIGREFLENIQMEYDSGEVMCSKDATGSVFIYYRFLPWDSNYFGIPTFRIEYLGTSDYKAAAINSLKNALMDLMRTLGESHQRYYIFSELPAENIYAIQAMCLSQWRMVETRLTYYREAITQYEYSRRFPVRLATEVDIAGLRGTAMRARNSFDRFHADFFFPEVVADEFLATFIENSINGFADITLVPNPDTSPPDAFLTANLLGSSKAIPGKNLARMILSAVDEPRRGWYVKLISEMSYIFKEKGIDVSFMTTQATNRAVIRTWEKLGYSLGRTTHIFAYVGERSSCE